MGAVMYQRTMHAWVASYINYLVGSVEVEVIGLIGEVKVAWMDVLLNRDLDWS